MRINERIKRNTRAAAALRAKTLREVARDIDMSEQQLSKFLQSQMGQIEKLQRIAEALGVSIGELIEADPESIYVRSVQEGRGSTWIDVLAGQDGYDVPTVDLRPESSPISV